MKLSVVSAKLGDPGVASVILGQSPPSSYYNKVGDGLPFFQGKADFQRLHPIPRVWCTSGRKFAEPGDVLISVRAPVGDVNVATDHCGIGRGLAAVRLGPDSDPWFLYFALLYSKPTLEAMATGSTFASVNRNTLNDLDIPFFDRSTQIAIGRFLRSLVYQIEQEDQALHTTQALKRAAMRTLFTRGLQGEAQKETEIGPMPESWEVVRVGDQGVATITLGQSPPSSAYNQTGNGLPFFQGKVDFGLIYPIPRVWCSSGRKFATTGDILISVRAPVGDVNVAAGDCVIGRGVSAIRPDCFSDPWFLYFALLYAKPTLEGRASGSTFASVNKRTLNDLPVPFPDKPEQTQIGNILQAIDRKIDLHRRKHAVLEELFKALLHKLMTGEIRVGELDSSILRNKFPTATATPRPIRSQA